MVGWGGGGGGVMEDGPMLITYPTAEAHMESEIGEPMIESSNDLDANAIAVITTINTHD